MNSLYIDKEFSSESSCKHYLRSRIYPDGLYCRSCGCKKVYSKSNGKFKCSSCKVEFSLYKDTIFECTKLSLKTWFIAMYRFGMDKSGLSSYQLARELGITQKTSYYMLMKIRELIKDNRKLGNYFVCGDCYEELIYDSRYDKYYCPKCHKFYNIVRGKVIEDENLDNTQYKYNQVLQSLNCSTNLKNAYKGSVGTLNYNNIVNHIKLIKPIEKQPEASNVMIDACFLGGSTKWMHIDKKRRQDFKDNFTYITSNKISVCCMYDCNKDIIKFIPIKEDNEINNHIVINNYTNGNVNLISDSSPYYDFISSQSKQWIAMNHKKGQYQLNGLSSNRIEGSIHHLKNQMRKYNSYKIKHIDKYLNEKAFRYNFRNNLINSFNFLIDNSFVVMRIKNIIDYKFEFIKC